jgi:hypothetical protein
MKKIIFLTIFILQVSDALSQNINPTGQLERTYKDFYVWQDKKESVSANDSLLTILGRWAWGPCYSVAVKGNYAFIGNGETLQALDISDPTNPKAVGQLLTDGFVIRVVVSGNYAYTISPFRIIDISNPANPILVSTFQLPAGYPPTAITVQGNYAYVGDFYGDVFIVDVSDPSNPQAIGRMLASGERVQSIVIQETMLYATTADGPGINVFDISNPNSPFSIRLVPTGSQPGISLSINGSYLYFGTYGRLLMFNISNPSNPRYVNEINLGSTVYSISVVDTIAFVALNTDGFAEVDVADTNNIHVVANIKNPYSFPNADGVGGPIGETISLPYAYLATSTGLWIVDIREPESMNSISYFPTGWYVNRIAVDPSNHAFLAELYGGLKILDFSDPSSPKLIGQYSPDEQVMDVVVANNFAYLLGDSDLLVIDVLSIGSPTFIGKVSFNDTVTTTLEGNFDFLCLNGSTIYVARKSQKLFAVDVRDPSHPVIKSNYTLREIPVGISQSNGYLYVAELDTGIRIFNISEPNIPQEEGFLRIVPIRGLTIAKNKLFVVGWEGTELGKGGLAEYDVTSPLNPTLKYLLNIPGGIMTFADLKMDDRFTYLAYGNTFLVVDISNSDSGRVVYSGNAITLGVGAFNSVAVSNGVILTGYMGVSVFKNKLYTLVEGHNELPKSFELFQNFPNPFNPGTLIKYQLSAESHVTLKIFDVLGRELQTVVNSIQQAGNYLIPFDASRFSSGVYLYRLEVVGKNGERSVSTKKMELLK